MKVRHPGKVPPDDKVCAEDKKPIFLNVVHHSRIKSFAFYPKGTALNSLFIAACHSFNKNPDKMRLIRAKTQHEYTLDELREHSEWRGLEHDEYLYLRNKGNP